MFMDTQKGIRGHCSVHGYSEGHYGTLWCSWILRRALWDIVVFMDTQKGILVSFLGVCYMI